MNCFHQIWLHWIPFIHCTDVCTQWSFTHSNSALNIEKNRQLHRDDLLEWLVDQLYQHTSQVPAWFWRQRRHLRSPVLSTILQTYSKTSSRRFISSAMSERIPWDEIRREWTEGKRWVQLAYMCVFETHLINKVVYYVIYYECILQHLFFLIESPMTKSPVTSMMTLTVSMKPPSTTERMFLLLNVLIKSKLIVVLWISQDILIQ